MRARTQPPPLQEKRPVSPIWKRAQIISPEDTIYIIDDSIVDVDLLAGEGADASWRRTSGGGWLSHFSRRERGGAVGVGAQVALAEEFELIESLLPRFRYVAVDTEFPGTLHRPNVPAYLLSSAEHYKFMRANVDNLHLIQLGLTLFDDDGRLPAFGAVQVVWEFNFREFDVLHHPHVPESIAMLRTPVRRRR
ncbi:hypothetical protein GUJ93_ZPchr0007g3683 [Zizania palustris]|uniref:Uncharacterized protein n=1 Tax=Zizania palustris TaxID=103762 RepID=A0A8J5TEF9_ZIZPA|nr:hypothetical protein GUJ93_ZPchr0007g3683 [Zizania palustris]